MQPKTTTLPYNASGYFSNLAEENRNLAENIRRRQMGFGYLLDDMGLRSRNGEIVADWSNPFGAFAEGARAARTDVAARGFGPSKVARRLAFAPIKNDIFKQTSRARGEMRFENQSDRFRRQQNIIAATRNAAQYGYEQRQPRERR